MHAHFFKNVYFFHYNRVLMCFVWHGYVCVLASLAQGSDSVSWIPADVGADVQSNHSFEA